MTRTILALALLVSILAAGVAREYQATAQAEIELLAVPLEARAATWTRSIETEPLP